MERSYTPNYNIQMETGEDMLSKLSPELRKQILQGAFATNLALDPPAPITTQGLQLPQTPLVPTLPTQSMELDTILADQLMAEPISSSSWVSDQSSIANIEPKTAALCFAAVLFVSLLVYKLIKLSRKQCKKSKLRRHSGSKKHYYLNKSNEGDEKREKLNDFGDDTENRAAGTNDDISSFMPPTLDEFPQLVAGPTANASGITEVDVNSDSDSDNLSDDSDNDSEASAGKESEYKENMAFLFE